MKQNTTNKNTKWIWIVAAIVIVIAAVAVILPDAEKDPIPAETLPAATEPAETTAPETEPEEDAMHVSYYDTVELVDGQIQTPYAVLNYPEALADHLVITNTSLEPYTLEFHAVLEDKTEVRLFDISMGKGSGGNIGTLKTEQGEIPVNVTIYTIVKGESWTEGEFLTLQAMQDVVNEIIDQLSVDEETVKESTAPVISEQPETNDTVRNMEIETPLCTLYYPAQWSSTIRFEQDDTQEDVYKVLFYSDIDGKEPQLLFAIYLGGDEGEQIGAVMNADGIPVPVNLIMGQLELKGWKEADIELMYNMQEAANLLIEKLPLLNN